MQPLQRLGMTPTIPTMVRPKGGYVYVAASKPWHKVGMTRKETPRKLHKYGNRNNWSEVYRLWCTDPAWVEWMALNMLSKFAPPERLCAAIEAFRVTEVDAVSAVEAADRAHRVSYLRAYGVGRADLSNYRLNGEYTVNANTTAVKAWMMMLGVTNNRLHGMSGVKKQRVMVASGGSGLVTQAEAQSLHRATGLPAHVIEANETHPRWTFNFLPSGQVEVAP